jgi:DNA-binding CsgD family transcriptional regulator
VGAGTETLLERDAELAVLEAALDRAACGEGSVVVVEGPPGIGKSELVRAAARRGRDRGFRVLSGRGGEFEREFAFGVVRQLFEPVVASLSPIEREYLLTGAAALAAPLVGVPTGEPGSAGDMFPLLHGLYWLAAGLASSAPLLIAVDDVHWVDGPTLRWLNYLVRRLDGVPAAVVLASRSTEPEGPVPLLQALKHEPGVVVARPLALSESATAAVVSEFFDARPEPSFSSACHEASGGNPFLVGELCRALAAEGASPLASAVAAVRTARPEAIARQALSRLDALPATARALAEAVAVFGGDVELRWAASVAGVGEEAAIEAADRLAAAALFAGDAPLRFTHAIVRAAVYGELGGSRRARLHHRAATVLIEVGEAEERVAAHLLLSPPHGDPQVVEWLRRAAATASARGSLDAACVYLRRALAEPPANDARPQVLVDLAGAEAAAADPHAATRLPDAFAAATDPRMRADAFEHAAWFLLASGRTNETLAMLETVRGELSRGDPGRELELEAQFVAAAMLDPDAIALAAERLSEVGEQLPGRSVGERMMLCHLAYHRMWRAEDGDRAAELARRALGGGDLLRERGVQPHELTGPIMALTCADELDEAAEVIDEAQAVAVARGSEHLFAFLSCMRAILAYRRGSLADAEAEARTSVEIAVRSGLLLGAAVGAGWLMWTLVDRDELDAAASVLETVCPTGDVPPQAPFSILLAARGRLEIATDRVADGLADLLECGRRNERFGIRNPVFVPWRAEAVRAQRLLGDLDAARVLADGNMAAATAWGTAGAIGSAHLVRALVAGTNDDAIEDLRQAEALLRRSPARLERARALVEFGAALRRSNLRAHARDLLREGLDLAVRCGASVLAEQAESELRATGARPRRMMLSGVASLTSTEARVAELAASGMSNPEIAQRMFVTRRTIETHLGHVYSKLNIGSRNELAAALAED